ncbi:MAG TPA: hypothetical protein VIL24_01015 [Clostridia bacterium]
MTFEASVKNLIAKIDEFEKNQDLMKKRALPAQCYFLDKDTVLCYPREKGVSRYPYSCDGRVIWAYSSGCIAIEESTLNIILPATEGKEPNIGFFAGYYDNDVFKDVSLLGTACKTDEKIQKRCAVFTPFAAYYLTYTDSAVFAVRVFMSQDKQACFTLGAFNISGSQIKLGFSSYFDCLLMRQPYEDFEAKWYKSSEIFEDGALMQSVQYIGKGRSNAFYAGLKRILPPNCQTFETASRSDYTGGTNNSLHMSQALKNGRFKKGVRYCEFTEKSIYGDLVYLNLNPQECARADYVLSVKNSYDEAKAAIEKDLTPSALDLGLEAIINQAKTKSLSFEFNNLKDYDLNDDIFNYFISSVMRQVEFCATAKNFAGAFLGVRDIFQQVEAALMWIPEKCRQKIIEAIGFIDESGMPPRQFSYPASKGDIPQMDLRKYIDQGLWIIHTVYNYIAFTNDFTILDEESGYYKLANYTVALSDLKDSVLDHLIKIADYLVSNIDGETGCLRALYGDWNDAIDGLGYTEDADKEFGSGVSIMASLQLYQALNQLSEILLKTQRYPEKASHYQETAKSLKKALMTYGVVSDGANRRILHGWGDKRSYFVGSFQDNDGASRVSATSHAFWALSGLIYEDVTLKKDIVDNFKQLDSKYGIMTFNKGFTPDNTAVGRIGRLPLGTAENAATYIHAALFAAWALFTLGESKFAWDQLYKVMPITHEMISVTPFVMPNSYVYNPEKNMDGESMNDWFTGSGCVLIKVLARCVFGIQPDLDGVNIAPAKYIPSQTAKMSINLKGRNISIIYQNKGAGKRTFYVNNKAYPAAQNEFGIETLRLSNKDLADDINILIED